MSESKSKPDFLYSDVVKAGKRTYFFDVREDRCNDLFINITESLKKWDENGDPYFMKKTLFLYKEDFENFAEGLRNTIDKIQELRETGSYSEESPMDRASKSEESDSDPNSVTYKDQHASY